MMPTGVSSRPAIPNDRLDLATRPDGSPVVDPGSAAILNALWPLPNIPNTPSNEVNYIAYQTPGISNWHIDTRFDAKINGQGFRVCHLVQVERTVDVDGRHPSV